LPPDIDRLVKQAMTLGTTHKLREAMLSHQEAEQEVPDENQAVDPRDTLERLRNAANAALEDHDANRTADRNAALGRIQVALSDWGPIQEVSVEEVPSDGPVIALPKVRRRYGLVVEGVGDVDRHEDIVNALGMDGATARMIAIARQPRVVLRGDDKDRMQDMAVRLQRDAGLEATIVDEERLRAMGPAWLLHGFEGGPVLVAVSDWTQAFETPSASSGGMPMTDAPLLVVPGEVVVLKYRSSRSGGRLKHLREGRMQAASEQRLALVDLHTSSGIVRILEGHTDLMNAPGAVEDGFRRSLRSLIENWREQGVRVLEPRTCSPSGTGGQNSRALEQAAFSTGWPDWEEHSRAAGALFIGDSEDSESPSESPDSPPADPVPATVD